MVDPMAAFALDLEFCGWDRVETCPKGSIGFGLFAGKDSFSMKINHPCIGKYTIHEFFTLGTGRGALGVSEILS